MTEISQLELADGVARLRGPAARGFLGLDPVTQNDALLRIRLDARQAQLFRCGDAILGYAPNPDNPRQAEVATTAEDPAVLGAFTAFLRRHRRYTSFVCYGGPPAALLGSGFRPAGRLRGHMFRSGTYHDVDVHVAVHVATGEEPS